MKVEYLVSLVLIGRNTDGDMAVALTDDGDVPRLEVGEGNLSTYTAIELHKAVNENKTLSWISLSGYHDSISTSPRFLIAEYVGSTNSILEKNSTTFVELKKIAHEEGTNDNSNVDFKSGTSLWVANRAIKHFAKQIESTNVASSVLPNLFSIKELHDVYAQTWPECNIDLPNFRRKMNKSGILVDSGETIGSSRAYAKSLSSATINPPFNRKSLKSK